MLTGYFKCCEKCVELEKHKASNSSVVDIDWCTVTEYCDIHLSNGSVFEDVVQDSCNVLDADKVEDIEMAFYHNMPDKESRRIVVRVGDIVSIVERHRSDS